MVLISFSVVELPVRGLEARILKYTPTFFAYVNWFNGWLCSGNCFHSTFWNFWMLEVDFVICIWDKSFWGVCYACLFKNFSCFPLTLSTSYPSISLSKSILSLIDSWGFYALLCSCPSFFWVDHWFVFGRRSVMRIISFLWRTLIERGFSILQGSVMLIFQVEYHTHVKRERVAHFKEKIYPHDCQFKWRGT